MGNGDGRHSQTAVSQGPKKPRSSQCHQGAMGTAREGQVGDCNSHGRLGSEGGDQEGVGAVGLEACNMTSSGAPHGRRKATASQGTRKGVDWMDIRMLWSTVTLTGRLMVLACVLQPTPIASRPIPFNVSC